MDSEESLEGALLPPEDVTRRALRCMALVRRLSRRQGAACVLFGSWAQDTPLDGSDLDVALTFTGRFEASTEDREQRIRALEAFAAGLRGPRLRVVEEVFEARVPILRLQYGGRRGPPLELDLSVGSSATGALDGYVRAEVEARGCRPLVLLAKFWARRRNVNKAVLACLNSLSWTLLVLFFVGTGRGGGPVREAFERFLSWVRALGSRPPPRRRVSVREGRWVPWGGAWRDQTVLWVEDPTAEANNTAHSLRADGWHATLQEVDRGLALLGRDEPLSGVCSDDAPSRVHLAPPHLRGKLARKRRTADAGPEEVRRSKLRRRQ